MNLTTELLMKQAAPILFGVVFLEQIGVPIPSAPWLLGAGAVSANGNLSPWLALSVTVLACLTADLLWFYLGRHKGNRALRLLCRVSLEPDSCVRRTQAIFTRYGMGGIVAAKFLPGFGILFPPLAGMSSVSPVRFLLYDALGSLLYTGLFLLLGLLFSSQLQNTATAFTEFSKHALWTAIGLGFMYVLCKYFQRKRLARPL
jgi:membrane protein DedA with SNARE-associated domain